MNLVILINTLCVIILSIISLITALKGVGRDTQRMRVCASMLALSLR